MTSYILSNLIYTMRTENNNMHFNFSSPQIDPNRYYPKLLGSLNKYQLKSLYDFISRHIIICRNKKLLTDSDTLEVFTKVEDMDKHLQLFINNDIIKEIFIINLIRVYFR